MRQSFSDIERRLAQNSADLRSRMAEMQKLKLAVKRAEASFGGGARLNRHEQILRSSPPRLSICVLNPTSLRLSDGFDRGRCGNQRPQWTVKLQPPQTELSAAPSPESAVSSGPSFCVRSCDGKYFPLRRGVASPTQLCEAFCPASATEVFFGSSIDAAYSENGKCYADSENAFAYRKALRADCTCNGRTPTGLAAVDLALDDTLRKSDVVATADGLVAFTGIGVNDPTSEFTPVSSFPGLTPQLRARLNDIKLR